jgi:uncharacterized protein YndB with AHSA1/START domain
MVTDQIEREVLIEAPVERVWELLTEAEYLGAWFGDAGAEIDLRPGGAMQLRWVKYGTTNGRVEVVERPHRFAYRWFSPDDLAASSTAAGDGPLPGNSTLVEFTLAEEGGATRLRVVESGFAALGGTEARRTEQVDDHTSGWARELDELIALAAQTAVGR